MPTAPVPAIQVGPTEPSSAVGISSGQHVEERFAQAVGGRADVQARQRTEGTAAVLAGDNSQSAVSFRYGKIAPQPSRNESNYIE